MKSVPFLFLLIAFASCNRTTEFETSLMSYNSVEHLKNIQWKFTENSVTINGVKFDGILQSDNLFWLTDEYQIDTPPDLKQSFNNDVFWLSAKYIHFDGEQVTINFTGPHGAQVKFKYH